MSRCGNSQQLVGEDAPALWRVVPRGPAHTQSSESGASFRAPRSTGGLASHLSQWRTQMLVAAGWEPRCVPSLSGQVSLCHCPAELALCPGPTLRPGFSLLAGPGIIADDVMAAEMG